MSDVLPPNPVPSAEQNDFATVLVRLQPRGRIWDNGPDSLMAQLRIGQAALMAQFNGTLAQLTEQESYPPTSELLLPAWEQAFGLPDPCTPLSPTIQQRQQALAARLAAKGGLSIASITAIAAALGYTITIQEFWTGKFGMPFGSTFGSQAWDFTWQVSAPELTVEYAKFDVSAFGEAYAVWGNTVLQCTLNRIKPPQTNLIFVYGS
jgi:uncharacterized protein YmfQ (DUF2313 family)